MVSLTKLIRSNFKKSSSTFFKRPEEATPCNKFKKINVLKLGYIFKKSKGGLGHFFHLFKRNKEKCNSVAKKVHQRRNLDCTCFGILVNLLDRKVFSNNNNELFKKFSKCNENGLTIQIYFSD